MERDSSGPRKGALSWDDYFMGLAFLTAMRSKDPSTQVGACIVNGRNRIVGVGYNGMPSNCSNDELPWGKKSHEGLLSTKYPYVVHAELNAVLNKNAESAAGCRIYTTLFPCNECAKVIIQAGIQQVIYASDKHSDRMSARATVCAREGSSGASTSVCGRSTISSSNFSTCSSCSSFLLRRSLGIRNWARRERKRLGEAGMDGPDRVCLPWRRRPI
ncbi:unnamed protein product [Durusdinium trenchii]|uniref:dCMP deaminase n=1 Tax=Durusdinium trenchii TaxID=1381693 RepID=A0ABP0MED3_9DINO